MNINWKLVSAGLAAVFVYDTTVNILNLRKIRTLNQRVLNARRRADYYASVLDKYEVPFTAFDEIVIDCTM